MLVIALVGMLVFLLFYYKSIAKIRNEGSCADYKGKCIPITESCEEGYLKESGTGCPDPANQACCMPVGT